MNNKANLKQILISGNLQKVKSDLRFLVACKSLSVTEKSKSSDVRCCVCVVLVHQPDEAMLIFNHLSRQHLDAVLVSRAMLSMAR